MSELVVTLLRLGYLALLWIFVLGAISVLRRDIYGTRIFARGSVHPAKSPAPGRSKPPAPVSRGVPTRLHVTAGRLSGTTMALGSTSITIGRDPACTLVLDDTYASTRHARIFPDNGSWYVEDLGSTNGTYLGSERLYGTAPLAMGAPVRIGQTVIELR